MKVESREKFECVKAITCSQQKQFIYEQKVGKLRKAISLSFSLLDPVGAEGMCTAHFPSPGGKEVCPTPL